MLRKLIKFELWNKRCICLLPCLLSATANAQASELLLADLLSSKPDAAVKTTDQVIDENARQVLKRPPEQVVNEKTENSAEASGSSVDTEPVTVNEQGDTEEFRIYRNEHPDNPCERGLDTYDYETSWYDSSQIYVNSKFCEPALWFDNFFANDRIFEEGVAGTYIRWRNEFTLDEEESFKFKMGISASVELPVLEKRLRLTLSDDEDEDLRDIAPGSSDNSSTSLGLQLDLTENARSKFSVSVSLSPKIRFRYRYTYPVLEDLTLRITQEVQRKKEIHSARTLFDFEQLFKELFLFRASTEAVVSEEFDGVDWLQAFVLYQRINKKTSLSYETSVSGITEPRTMATNYRVGLRFRKNFHREWLFYEIAPEMTWPITFDEDRINVEIDRRSRWLLFFRLEIHFGNAHKKRYQDYH